MADDQSAQNQAQKQVEPVAPGTVITPGENPQPTAPATITPTATEQQPAITPEDPPQAAEVTAQPVTKQQPEAVMPDTEALQPPTVSPSSGNEPGAITWTASEFVSHDKSSEWYMALAGGAIAAAGLMFAITRDFVSVGVVLAAALIFGIYGNHKPRQLQYRIDRSGITIGAKSYSFDEFMSFSVIPEGAFSSIVFMPLRRFAAPLNIYYAPEDEDKIVEVLIESLPYEQRRRDAVDSLMRKVRF